MAEPFLWGAGGKKITPGQAAVLRQIAAQKSQVGTPSNLGEGLNAIGSALVSNAYNARAGEAETEGQQAVAAALAQAQASGDPNALYGVVADPWATEGQRMVAGTLLDKANMMEGRAYDEGLFGRQVNARIEAGQGLGLEGDALTGYGLTGGYDVASGADTGYRAATPEEKQAYGLPPDTPAQVGPDGQFSIIPNAAKIGNAGENLANNQATTTSTIIDAASTARALSDNEGNVGLLGATFGMNPTTDAAELRRQVDVLKSNATIANLSAMRQASPTGGALGSVTEKENAMLAAAAGALTPDASKEQFQKALDNYERTLLRIVHGPAEGDRIYAATRNGGTMPTAAPAANSGPGWSVVGVE